MRTEGGQGEEEVTGRVRREGGQGEEAGRAG